MLRLAMHDQTTLAAIRTLPRLSYERAKITPLDVKEAMGKIVARREMEFLHDATLELIGAVKTDTVTWH